MCIRDRIIAAQIHNTAAANIKIAEAKVLRLYLKNSAA